MAIADSTPIEFEPALTMEQVEDSERDEKVLGRTRRAAYLYLTRSSHELRDLVSSEGMDEATLDLAECLHSYIDRKEAELELMRSANARILSVLSEVIDTDE